MLKIILTKGLPASGKTTWAKDLMAKEPGKWKRVNKDDLRAMLDDSKWSRGNEKFILESRDFLVTTALLHGYNVIVDDTNLAPKHEQAMIDLAMLMSGKNKKIGISNPKEVKVEIKDFTDVPPEVCIERDLKRANSVGSKVIMQMYDQFLAPQKEKVKHYPDAPEAIICDVDGTLALFEGSPYDRDFSKDTLNSPVASTLERFASNGIKIIIVSGRKNSALETTKKWLETNNVPCNEIYMPRSEKDWRKDFILKEEIYNEHIKGKNNIKFVLDDRDQVVRLWRRLGLTCLQVADGDF